MKSFLRHDVSTGYLGRVKLPAGLPGFTEMTRRGTALSGLLLSVFLALILVALQLILPYEGGYSFFGASSILVLVHMCFCLFAFRGNLVITIRYLLIILLGLATSGAWWLWSGSVHTAPFGVEY